MATITEKRKLIAVEMAMRELGPEKNTISAIREFIKERQELWLRPTEIQKIKEQIEASRSRDLVFTPDELTLAAKAVRLFQSSDRLVAAYETAKRAERLPQPEIVTTPLDDEPHV